LENKRRKLLKIIEAGLRNEGINGIRRKPGMWIKLDDKIFRIWINYQTDQRWWRITCAYGCEDRALRYHSSTFSELTACLEEIDEETGIHLARFLKSDCQYRWPLFEQDQSYPKYAWSAKGWEKYMDYQKDLEMWKKQKRQKNHNYSTSNANDKLNINLTKGAIQ